MEGNAKKVKNKSVGQQRRREIGLSVVLLLPLWVERKRRSCRCASRYAHAQGERSLVCRGVGVRRGELIEKIEQELQYIKWRFRETSTVVRRDESRRELACVHPLPPPEKKRGYTNFGWFIHSMVCEGRVVR